MRDRAIVQIMPSTACNARCPYCYEEGHSVLSMNEDVRSAVVRFVLSLLHGFERVHIVWFGGEPLLCMEMIESICSELFANPGCDKNRLSQSLITNGAFIQSALARGFFNQCGIAAIQVSMDGYGSDNAHTKRFIRPECSYDKLIENIKNCLVSGYQVTVRMNVSSSNGESLAVLSRDLLSAFGDFDAFSIYPAPLYGKGEQYLNPTHINAAMLRYGNMNGSMRAHRRKPGWNCFDNCTYVVQPDGFVVPCEHLFGIKNCYLGNVLTGINYITAAEMASICAMCSNVAACKQGCYSTDSKELRNRAEQPCGNTHCWRSN